MVSQRNDNSFDPSTGVRVSIPVRGSGKSKQYREKPGFQIFRVSIPVRGSGKSKTVVTAVVTAFSKVSIPVRGSGKSKI